MSTLRVDNITPSAGGTAFSITGIAKTYWKYDQTTPVVVSSENVSSISDDSGGSYTVNFTNAMATADYAFGGIAGAAAQILQGSKGTPFSSTTDVSLLTITADANELDGTSTASMIGDLA